MTADTPCHLNLMTYRPAEVAEAVRGLADMSQPGKPGWLELWRKLSQIKLRDADGAYWLVGPASGKWYRYEQGAWSAGQEPTCRLVGLAMIRNVLDFHQNMVAEPEEPEAQPEHAPPVGEDTTQRIEAFVGNIRSIVEQFDSGGICSRAAERALANSLLPDKQGRLWTVAARSSQWHMLEETGWRPAPPIPADWLPTVDELPGLTQAVARNQVVAFIVGDVPPIPEPIVEPLSPPPGMPELPAPPMTPS